MGRPGYAIGRLTPSRPPATRGEPSRPSGAAGAHRLADSRGHGLSLRPQTTSAVMGASVFCPSPATPIGAERSRSRPCPVLRLCSRHATRRLVRARQPVMSSPPGGIAAMPAGGKGMADAPAPWRNPVYVAATIVQALGRRRWRPELAYGAGDLRRHLIPTAAERERRARRTLPYLGITTLMLDEARDLREWIEFHRLQGVERFYLYDNGSTDDTEEVVRPYVEEGIAELVPWPHAGAQRAAIARRKPRDLKP